MSSEMHRISLSFNRSELFDAVAKVGDGGAGLGQRIVCAMLSGDIGFGEAMGLALYGVSISLPFEDTAHD